jgi:hypothetical protein
MTGTQTIGIIVGFAGNGDGGHLGKVVVSAGRFAPPGATRSESQFCRSLSPIVTSTPACDQRTRDRPP